MIISWNTRRTYTEHGQRIAAIAVEDGVFFSDQDRGISAYLPDCELSQSAVMQRYDSNDRMEWSIPMFTGNRWALIDRLNAASKGATGNYELRRV